MSDKQADTGGRAIGAIAGLAAAFCARKLIAFAWKRVTGREPPQHPEDPQVSLAEALVWGILIGAGVHTARMLTSRAISRRQNAEPTDNAM